MNQIQSPQIRTRRRRNGPYGAVEGPPLGLVLNAVVLWTTPTTWTPPSSSCGPCPPTSASTTSWTRTSLGSPPPKHADRNVLGRYSFRTSTPAGGGLRPLRDPGAVDDDTDE